MVNGVLLVDKPQGITSHDAVARARRALGTKKVGHAGTLDPMATGLLVLGVGPATRLLTYVVGLDKEYTATIRLGQSTTTDDAEGEILGENAVDGVTEDAVRAGIAALTGDILQRPSSVSAIKVDGRRAYDRVRAGEDVELPERAVRVRAFEVVAERRVPSSGPRESTGLPGPSHEIEVIDLDVRVECSSGTYIRALARDLGEALGVGGHLTALRRTRVGPFDVRDAVPLGLDTGFAVLDAREQLREPTEVASRLFPVLALDAEQAADLANGKRIRVDHPDASTAAAVAPDGRLVGLVAVEHGRIRVLTNFPPEPK